MILLEVRKKFVELTGRYDLVTDLEDWGDSGADFFIRAGQDWLDRKIPFPKDEADVSVEVSAGESLLTIGRYRSIRRVRVAHPEGIAYLKRVSIQALRETYKEDLPFTTVQRSVPTLFAPAVIRGGSPVSETTEGEHAIVIAPPPSQDVTVTIEGLRFSEGLEEDGDISYWTVVHPMLLIQAAMYKMEQAHRNREGARDHQEALLEALQDIDFDNVDADVARPLTMRNSW